jgi:hypothetical protein
MKKIGENRPVYGLHVKFAEGVNYNDEGGRITQIYLKSRNKSVPMIVTAANSEAKKSGQDGIFALCSEKCGAKMKETLKEELQFSSMELT